MKKTLRGLCIAFLFVSINPEIHSQTPGCPAQSSAEIPDFSGTPVQIAGSFNGVYDEGDIYRFYNIVTLPYVIHVDVTIEAVVNAVVEELDDNSTRENRFQPLLDPDPDYLGNSLDGYVQYTMTLRRGSDLAIIPFNNLELDHDNLDGRFFNADRRLRETGWVSGVNSISSGILIVDQGTVSDGGYDWRKLLGDHIEHDPDYNDDPNVSYTATLSAATAIRFRAGYEYIHLNDADTLTIRSRDYSYGFRCLDVPPNIPLPVRLLSFTGTYRSSGAVLNWTTENEVNFEKFEIQRSGNGREFVTQGTMNSRGSTVARIQYNFTDNLNSQPGNVFYYRLKMIDHDGRITFSQVLVIQKQGKAVKGLVVNPNPVSAGNAVIKLSTAGRSKAEFRVIDLNGRIVLRQQNELYEGNNVIILNEVSRLKPGIYIIQMQNQFEIISTKFSVVR